MSNHKGALVLASASWVQLHGLTQAYQAAVLRGDLDGAEAIRRQAHDLLDANLDYNANAAQAARNIIGV